MSSGTRLLLATVAGVVLTACSAPAGSASTSASTSASSTTTHRTVIPPDPCVQDGSKTLAADRSVRVFSMNGFVYGCSRRTALRTKLGKSRFCISALLVDPVVVAGNDVAYGAETCGVDTGNTQVIVRRLTDGKQLRAESAVTGQVGVESYEFISSMVVKPDGAVAWIAHARSLAGKGPNPIEVHAADAHGTSLLDSGPAVAPDSLRLRGSKLTWTHGGAVRSATLD